MKHECSVVFLTPGQYKVDIQCSTSEPIEENIIVSSYDNSMVEITQEISKKNIPEVNHVWRFIPPVAISVME